MEDLKADGFKEQFPWSSSPPAIAQWCRTPSPKPSNYSSSTLQSTESPLKMRVMLLHRLHVHIAKTRLLRHLPHQTQVSPRLIVLLHQLL
jgi:hypothetical protein